MIRFNVPEQGGNPLSAIAGLEGIDSGGKAYQDACRALERIAPSRGIFLTSSGSHALEFSARLMAISPGDEIIMPSYTYYSTANAFLSLGAEVVFVDIEPYTMTMDASLVEDALTDRTRAIVAVHYGGVSSDMDLLTSICEAHDLILIEDSAQSLGATYHGRALGTIGDTGVLSFHATKNITSGGEGGALLINDPSLLPQARLVSQHGTDRLDFLEGKVDRYTWHGIGSSYILNEISCAYLASQLKDFEMIQGRRRSLWELYHRYLSPLAGKGSIRLQKIPDYNEHNSHLFAIFCEDTEDRARLQAELKGRGIETATHYMPLHTTPFGKTHTRFIGEDRYTTSMSQRLLRLPLHTRLTPDDVKYVCESVYACYGAAFEA